MSPLSYSENHQYPSALDRNYRLIISIVLDNVERASIFTELTEEKPSALKRHADRSA